MGRIKDVPTALDSFEKAVHAHSVATEQGEYKSANKHYDRIVRAIVFLKEHDALMSLQDFLDHPSAGVRTWAALYLSFLPGQEKEAECALEEVARGEGILAGNARTILDEWNEGSLKLPR